ncbi:hypothetical protein FJZ28_02025 [Candidatus Peregrinibacteria bacterium]|nr:hypothetical protein [Candidatus Peregrinibacteria bacterium]
METDTNEAAYSALPVDSGQFRELPHKTVGRPRSVAVPAMLATATFVLAVFMLRANHQSPVVEQRQGASHIPVFAAAPEQEPSIPWEFLTPEEVLVNIDPDVLDPVESTIRSEDIDAQVTPHEFQVLPIPAPPEADASSYSTHAAGIYFTSTSAGRRDFFEGSLQDLKNAGGNAFVVDVKGSAVFFDAESQLAKDLGLVRKQYDLQELITNAHDHGLYVIGRFVAVKDAGLARAHPRSLIVHPVSGKTIGYEFVDPENETVLSYNSDILCLLAQSSIDEVNLDYIRFSTEQVGELRVFSTEEKARKVGAFVSMARETIDRCGPRTVLGLSTFAILGWNYEVNMATLGQDVVAWAPKVDIISPMAYPSTFAAGAYYDPAVHKGSRNYYLVLRTLAGYKQLLGEHAWKLRPWIQGYGMTLKGMSDQMKAVADAGFCGFTVWSAENIYGNTFKAMENWKRGEEC